MFVDDTKHRTRSSVPVSPFSANPRAFSDVYSCSLQDGNLLSQDPQRRGGCCVRARDGAAGAGDAHGRRASTLGRRTLRVGGRKGERADKPVPSNFAGSLATAISSTEAAMKPVATLTIIYRVPSADSNRLEGDGRLVWSTRSSSTDTSRGSCRRILITL